MEDYPLARMWRDARLGQIGGGTSEILCEIIAKILIDGKGYEEPEIKQNSFLVIYLANGQPASLRTIALVDLVGLPALDFVAWRTFFSG